MRTLGFSTPRLRTGDWRTATPSALAAIFAPDVIRALPPEFHSADDDSTRRSVLIALEDEATVLGLFDSQSAMNGLLILSPEISDSGTILHLGYLLAQNCWGQGLAGEMLTGLQEAARMEPTLWALSGGVALDNPASARVLERAGFQRQSVEDGVATYLWINVPA